MVNMNEIKSAEEVNYKHLKKELNIILRQNIENYDYDLLNQIKLLLEEKRESKIKNIVKRLSPEVLESINKLGLSVLESYIKNM